MFSLSLLIATVFASITYAATVTYNFDIGWVSASPDGFTRPVIGINGQWPIPMIEANLGDTIVVNVQNSLGNESASLHFHGMYQKGTAPSDGGVGISQCPINPGESYTYSFKAEPAGTFWYHSHAKGQYPDGLRGKMIVHDPDWEKSLNVVEQIPLSMSDWYHTQMPYLIHDYLSPDNTNGALPTPDSFLFNETRTAPTFKFQPGKRYLLRIVNIGALACGQFHIDGHKLTVVGVDGVHVQPKDATTILVCAGQRYDVIVTGASSATSGFNWIAKMTTDMLTGDIPPDDVLCVIGKGMDSLLGSLLGIITNLITPDWNPPADTILDDTTLKPLDKTPLFTGVNNNIDLQVNQTYYDGIGTRIGLGPQPWTGPKLPSLFTALTTGSDALTASTYGVGVNPWVVRSSDTVQIYLKNPQVFPHPMHLHGHEFQTVSRGTGDWNGDESSLPAVPMMRDTIVIPAGGYVVLRFKADNPGVWFFHCHIDMHLVGGMAATIVESPDVLQKQLGSVPAAGAGLCTAAKQCTSGNCACKDGGISASDSAQQCNTILNSGGESYGALIGEPVSRRRGVFMRV
ncbi:multicopper oxidase 1 [Polyplosphaeria fusca]|uniref:Multicopper oxidase 1 n=1 Tax=Polyplosphaeria fusca TaxID=682080 RepID=A0A9P4UYQ2_9PLEO|nr:multicopper oxidase 1 [Polyplosphaeria fusca]